MSPSTSASSLACIVCGAHSPIEAVERGSVRSNVRRFADQSFAIWRCPVCRSIHAADDVDLDFYYAHYPFHQQAINFGTRLMFAAKLRSLNELGVKPQHRILDYGSGGGGFVQYLIEQGYREARGYDPYVKEGPASLPLGTGYDVVLSQDVIEHVHDPREHLQTLIDLSVPGGLLVLGTPNAAVVAMEQLDEYIHMLHQPYHRHILTADTLTALGESLGLELRALKPGFFGNRAIPGLNGRFMRRVLRLQGEVIDDLVAGKATFHWQLLLPGAIWDALTGSMRDEGHDMTVAFRVSAAPRSSSA